MKKYLELAAMSVIVGVAVFGFLRMAGSIPVSVTSTAKQSTFDVQGEGKVTVKPDEAVVSVGVHKEAASVKTATEQVDQVMTKLSEALKSQGIKEDDIKTTGYNVYQNYSNDGSVNKTYSVNSSVEIKIRDIEKVGAVVDLIGEQKLEQAGGLMFTLSDSLREKTTKQAREMAIAKAKSKAEELASIAGMRLGRIVNVQEGYIGGIPVPMYGKTEMARDMSVSSTPAQIETGTNDVTVSVTLSYETL